MKSLAYAGVLFLLLFFGIGFSYFYPAQSPIANHVWFSRGILPLIDGWLVGGVRGAYSGHLLNSEGELRYKSESDFVFYPARGSQRFFGKTMISSGLRSHAIIEITDGIQVELKSNSLLVIEPQVEGSSEGPVVRVIGGAVVAKATKRSAAKKVRVVANNGATKVIEEKAIAVVSDGKGFIGEVVEDIDKLREELAYKDEQIAAQERLLREEALRAEAIKAEDLKEEALKAEALKAKAQKPIEEFLLTKIEDGARSPALVSEERATSVVVPQKISRRPFNESLSGTVKDAPKTSLAQGVYRAKRGQNSDATRLFASTLSSPLYRASKEFNPSVQIALNGLFESYEIHQNCQQAKDTLANAKLQYSQSSGAQDWLQKWQDRLSQGKCKNQL